MERTQLAEFVTELATDFDKYIAYEEDPEAAMTAAGLGEEDKELLRSGSFQQISEAFYEDDDRGSGAMPVIQGP
jgi:hypothetical protein